MANWKNDDTFLARWLAGNLTEKEQMEFESDPEYDKFVRLKESMSNMHAPEINEEETYRALKDKIAQVGNSPVKVKRLSRRRLMYVISAAAVLLLIIAYIGRNQKLTRIDTPVAEQRSYELPDGSVVKINASSEIAFNEKTFNQNRSLRLRGEAFFEVEENEDIPFTVVTNGGDVEVLGTSFNVYYRDDLFTVACSTGSVLVTGSGKKAALQANQSVSYENGTMKDLQNVPGTYIGSWTTGTSRFYRMPVIKVFSAMERQYDIEIVANLEERSEEAFTGGFVHDDIDHALQMVCIPMGLEYKKTSEGRYVIE